MRNAPIAWPLALLLVLFLAGAAHAAGPGYIAVDLGPAGGTSSSATAVNDAGVVAGQVDYHGHGLRAATWTETAGFVPLPILWNGMLTAVSPNGHLAATMDVYGAGPSGYAGPDPHAFAWTGRADAAPVDLGSLGSGRTAAYSVNDAGEVVGDSNVDVLSPLENRAFAWTPIGGMFALGTLGGDLGHAAAINASGVIAGWSSAPVAMRAVIWSPGGGIVDLGSLAGVGHSSAATAINDSGEVVGDTDLPSGSTHAFSWTHVGGMVDLGDLPGSDGSEATAVSSSGQIVGISSIETGPTGWTWSPATGMTPLPGLGGSYVYPHGVNARGWIVGQASTAGNKQAHAVIWRPVGSRPLAPTTPLLEVPASDRTPDYDLSASRINWLTGWAEDGSTVTLYRDGVAVGSRASDPETGFYEIGDTVPADGVYTYSAKTTDTTGRASIETPGSTLTVDATGPDLHVRGVPSGTYDVTSIPARPSFAPTDPHGVTAESDSWTPAIGASGVGTYEYAATAVDMLQNTSRETRTYTVRYGPSFAASATGPSRFAPDRTVHVRFHAGLDDVRTALWVEHGSLAHAPSALAPARTRLRWDGHVHEYSFDLATKTAYVNPDGTRIAHFTPGVYTLTVTLDDGTVRTMRIDLGPVPLAITRAPASSARPHAGTTFALTFAVFERGTTRVPARPKITVVVRIGQRLVEHTARFRNGIERIALRLPPRARGKHLAVTITVRKDGATVTRTARFAIT